MNNYYYITEQNEKTQEQLSKYDYDKKKINEDIFDWKLNNMSNKKFISTFNISDK